MLRENALSRRLHLIRLASLGTFSSRRRLSHGRRSDGVLCVRPVGAAPCGRPQQRTSGRNAPSLSARDFLSEEGAGALTHFVYVKRLQRTSGRKNPPDSGCGFCVRSRRVSDGVSRIRRASSNELLAQKTRRNYFAAGSVISTSVPSPYTELIRISP